ncbi:sterol desaturase family protein [Xanthocytophaga agilis]|uniref:Sterol desaturase family protein n=1 Tax=Xanthocytophaga agilis TaxID=3048010 RepID=A0AAE3RB44_9BACT|nr:sterol desaturase family protein [Xanthocytophaga agilis]MDJ1504113.1 sterol desaturase family protein [Xanthocytophaga agilis]
MEVKLLSYTVPLFAFFIVLEMVISAWLGYRAYRTKDTIVNLACTSLNFGFDVLMRGVQLAVLTFVAIYSPFHWQKNWQYWILLFLAEDLAYYTLHVVDHYCRFFWAIHITHHSSEQFNLTVAIRSSVFQPLYRFFYFIPLALVGFEALDILFMYAVSQTYGFFVHTEMVGKLGILEYILVTPSHHRVHHASNEKYLDKNMGMVLIIWDRIFGTFREEEEKPVYGITTKMESDNLYEVVTYEWKHMLKDLQQDISWKQKLKYIFGRPGWRHDK